MVNNSEALSCYIQSVQFDIQRIKTWSYLFSLLQKQGRFELCHSMLERLTKLIDEEAKLQYYLYTANRNLGKQDQALIAYERALKINPKLYEKEKPVTLFRAASLSILGLHTKAL